MTGTGQVNLRMQTAFDRLAWGFSDLQRIAIERGAWPARSVALVGTDGAGWTVTGARLRSRGKASNIGKPAGLLVADSECLWGQMALPDIPRQRLEQAVTEAMWRVSPVPPDQVAVAWNAVPKADGSGWMVDWGLCRQDVLAQQVASRSLPATAPVYLQRQGRAWAVRNAGAAALARGQRWRNALGLLLLLVVLAALALPALMPLILARQDVVRAVVHVSDQEPKAAPLKPQLDELRTKVALAQELKQNISTNVPLASVLEVLSDAIPDEGWLDRIEINGAEVRVSGMTGNAADLLARLGRHASLADVRSTTANVRDNTLGKERFTFDMRWREEGSKP